MRRCLVAAALTLLPGCSGVEKAPPRPKFTAAPATLELDVPPIMRGTVASESIILGYQPVVVRGYGLVVGLQGTGSQDIPADLRSHMIQEMARRGIGSPSSGYGDLKPEEMLRSLDTAVVVVEAVIPPASIRGSQFDVRVYADPRTGTTSLEGGTLYTTELRPGPLRVGRAQARTLALARGPIFINPFADPAAVGRDNIDRRSGRILNGGIVARDIPIKLRLATPSHTRAITMQDSINSRFPQEPGQKKETAHGESDESIEITVPPSYRHDTREFVQLLRHSSIQLSGAETIAASIRRVLLNEPSAAEPASWRWQALGTRVLPIIKDLYDYPTELPRMAALRAGAKLNDPLVIPHLIDMTKSASRDNREKAIALLSEMGPNLRIDFALRDLLNDPDLEIRLSAYEALVERDDVLLTRVNIDDKFILDVVESDYPLIYISQLRQPRIAVFGEELAVERPTTVSVWSNRLMIKADVEDEPLEVYYRTPNEIQGTISDVEPQLAVFVPFLGHQTTIEKPEPGIGLTYAETVGALYQIWRQGSIKADFKAEQDRILAAILDQREEDETTERPEFSDPDFADLNPDITSETSEPVYEPEMSDLDRLSPVVPR